MSFELPKLPYDFNELEPVIDAKTMEIHHDKHHAGYVKKLNDTVSGTDLEGKEIEEILKNIEDAPEEKKQAVINSGGGHANHSLFWDIMIGKGKGGEPSERLMEAMKDSFGSGENCHKQFVDAAVGHFGSGWAWIVVNPEKDNGLEIITTSNQDSPLMLGKIPILGIDVWEHAYYLKYQNERNRYVDTWTSIINWNKVSELYENALK